MNRTDEPDRFVDGAICGVKVLPLAVHSDDRGWLVELFRSDTPPPSYWPPMAYVSQTLPGVARGPHEHVDQTDFVVFLGPGEFMLYLWDARADSPTRGKRMRSVVGQENPVGVEVPPGVVHAYRNTGGTPGLVFNAPSRLYAGEGRRGPIDEIRHEQRPDSPYVMD